MRASRFIPSRPWSAWFFAVIAVLTLGARTPGDARSSDTRAAVNPFSVIDRAIARWEARPRPAQLTYTVDFTGHNRDKLFRRRFRIDETVATDETRVTTLSADGQAPPFIDPQKQQLLPTETFGFVPRNAPAPLPAPLPEASALPVIAAVHALVRYPYDVSYAGTDALADRTALHFTFVPRRTPDAFPLREIWIDASTYDVLQVVAQRFDRLGPITIPYRLQVAYAEQGPYWLVHRASAGATVHAGIFSYGSSASAEYEDYQYGP